MEYTLLKDVYLDGEVRAAGSTYTISDESLAKALLERGSIGTEAVEIVPTPSAFESAQAEVAEAEAVAQAEAEAVTADPTPLVEAPLKVQNQQVQPTPEQITEDLQTLEAPSVVQPTDLNIQ